MMYKKKILMIILMIPMIIALLPILSQAAMGASCSFVTVPNNITYPDGWFSTPQIQTSSDVIDQGNPVNACVVSSGLPCIPYNWSVSGTGYPLSKATTYGDLEKTVLSCIGGT